MIRILKASAGSGKTYNLARTYISLLLQSDDRYAYRHVLAVTFTNKATGEMKSRILRELLVLSSDPRRSPYFADFVPSVCKDEEDLRMRSEGILLDILHDYSAFSVSTIDKFFQQALKTFAKEIGYYASYQVELDRGALIQETVDRMLDGLTEDDRVLLDWMVDSVHAQMDSGKRFTLDRNLVDTGNLLKSTEHATMVQETGLDELRAYSKENIAALRKVCRDLCESFTAALKADSQAALAALDAAGLTPLDSSSNWMAPLTLWAALGPRDKIKEPTPAFLARCRDESRWFRKGDAPRCLAATQPALGDALEAIADLVDTRGKDWRTAMLILSTVDTLGLAREFYREFDALVREKNVMSLDDGNTILRKIIDGSDAPFIYERLGVRYEHFLLDEFQDTSGVQWDNFQPLLEESDA